MLGDHCNILGERFDRCRRLAIGQTAKRAGILEFQQVCRLAQGRSDLRIGRVPRVLRSVWLDGGHLLQFLTVHCWRGDPKLWQSTICTIGILIITGSPWPRATVVISQTTFGYSLVAPLKCSCEASASALVLWIVPSACSGGP